MIECLRSNLLMYWNDCIPRFPSYIFLLMMCVACVGAVTLISWKGLRRGIELMGRLMLTEAVFVIYYSTLIYRQTNSVMTYNLHPFWSYRAIWNGTSFLIAENVMNVLAFIPIGLLIGVGFPKWSWCRAIGFGCLISVSIEFLQYFFRRGFSEFDDVFHNTFGCVIGYGIVELCSMTYLTLRTK